MKKLFTLTELIIVIVVIAILAAIVIPNVSSFKEEANISAIKSNVRNIQTATDMYSNKYNGEIPGVEKPIIGKPQYIDYSKIEGKYLRDLPKTKGARYWIDYSGTVYGSTVPLPEVESKDGDAGTLSWKPVPSAKSYTVYEKDGDVLKVLKKDITDTSFDKGSTGDLYVSAEDKYALDTPAVGEGHVLGPEDENTAPPTVGGGNIEVGDYIVMGTHNSKQVLWHVVDEKSDGYVLFNFEGIDTEGTTFFDGDNDWEVSPLRTYFNSTFYQNAFSAEQKALINDQTRPVLVSDSTRATSGSEYPDISIYQPDSNSSLEVGSFSYNPYYKKNLTDKVTLPDLVLARDILQPMYTRYGSHSEDVINESIINYSTETIANIYSPEVFHLFVGDEMYDGGITTSSSYSDDTLAPVILLDKSAKPKAGAGTRLNPFNFNEGTYSAKRVHTFTLSDQSFSSPSSTSGTQTFDVDLEGISIPGYAKNVKVSGTVSFTFDGDEYYDSVNLVDEPSGASFAYSYSGQGLSSDTFDQYIYGYDSPLDLKVKLSPGTSMSLSDIKIEAYY